MKPIFLLITIIRIVDCLTSYGDVLVHRHGSLHYTGKESMSISGDRQKKGMRRMGI